MWAKSCRRSLLAFCMTASLLAAAPSGRTQDKDKEKDKEEQKDPINILPFEATEVGINVCAMVACVGSAPFTNQGHPVAIIGTRLLAGKEEIPLTKWQFSYEFVMPINRLALEKIVDGRLLPDLRDKELRELPVADRAAYFAYKDALRHSHTMTREQFEKSAEEYKDTNYTDLAVNPKRYRGKIITIKGKMNVIRRTDAPRDLQDAGLKYVFSGFVTGPTKGAPPFTIVMTELPEGVPGATENFDREVSFQGYFLANVRHAADKEKGRTKKDVISPWLIGKTATVLPSAPIDDDARPTASYILAWTVGAIVAVAILVALLNAWFRRGDRAVQSKLAEMRDRQQPFNLEPADEPETPQETKEDFQRPS